MDTKYIVSFNVIEQLMMVVQNSCEANREHDRIFSGVLRTCLDQTVFPLFRWFFYSDPHCFVYIRSFSHLNIVHYRSTGPWSSLRMGDDIVHGSPLIGGESPGPMFSQVPGKFKRSFNSKLSFWECLLLLFGECMLTLQTLGFP